MQHAYVFGFEFNMYYKTNLCQIIFIICKWIDFQALIIINIIIIIIM